MKLKIYLLTFSLLFLYGMTGAQTASVTEGCFPLQVQFTAPGGTTTYFWDFQDGATSDLENPVNTFTTAGTFDVEFSASPGGPVLGMVTITVFEEPVITITASTQIGCGPLSVDFNADVVVDPNIVVTGYEWVFGDGQTVSGTSTPNHVFTNVGTYFVSLEITTNILTCNTTTVVDDFIEVVPGPDANFLTDPSSLLICEGPVTVSFTNLSTGLPPLTYSWDFGDGTSSSLEDPPPITYSDDGSYPIILTVTDASGCQSSTNRTLQLGQPQAIFSLPDTVCVGQEYQVENLSPMGQYLWEFGPDATPMMSNNTAPLVTFNAEGVYPVTFTLTSLNGLCSSDTTLNIYAEDIDAEIIADPTYSCNNPFTVNYSFTGVNVDSLLWTFTGDSTTSEPAPVFEYNIMPDSFSVNEQMIIPVTLTVMSPSGCALTVSHFDTLHMPNALFMPDVVDGCAPLTVQFSDSSTSNENIVSWEYLYDDGNTATFNTDDPHSYTFNTPGEYEVRLVVTNEAGCRDTSYAVTIEVGDVLMPDFSVDLTDICPGDSVQFTDLTPFDSIDVWHFEAEGDRLWHCFDNPNPTWTFENETGFMDVTLTVGYNGCYSSVTQEDLIFVNGPLAKIDYRQFCDDPFTVHFADSSLNAVDVEWDFGTGDTSTDSFPSYTFPATGDYEVMLTAFDPASGCAPSTDTITVNIRDIRSEIILDTILCRDASVTLDGSLSDGVDDSCRRGYTWQFSDPSMRPITTPMPQTGVSFSTSGPVTVYLIVEDIHGCKDTSEIDVEVYGVDADFISDKETICYPSDVQFTDLSIADTTIVDWQWSFGEGGSSDEQNPDHTYISGDPNMLSVELVVTDTFGCTNSVVRPIGVYAPTSEIFLEPADTNLCTGSTTVFSASDFTVQGSFLSFNWDFGNGLTSTDSLVNVTYDEEGNYTAILSFVEDSTGCSGSVSVDVNVQDFPATAFATDVDDMDILCNPQSVIFSDTSSNAGSLMHQWIFGNGETATGPMAGTVYGKGTYTATLIVTTSFGCTDTLTRDFIVEGPEGDFIMDDDTICRGETILFQITDTTEVGSFEWFFGDGTSEFGVNPVEHQYNFVPPTFQTVATLLLNGVDNACSAAVEKPVYFHPLLSDFIRNDGIDTAICQGPYPFFDNSLNADSWSWNFGDGSTSDGQDPVHTFPGPGTYPVSLAIGSDLVSCTDTITKDVVILENPVPIALGDTVDLGCIGEIRIANPNPFSTYTWMPAELFSDPSAWSQEVGPFETTVYGLQEIDMNGCIGSDTAIFVVDKVRDVYIPNAFTPNFDGINDAFTVYGGKSVSLIRDLKVFNRWGGLVFEAQNIAPGVNAQGWDGTLNGRRLNNGVFVYYAEVEYLDQVVETFTGNVTIVK